MKFIMNGSLIIGTMDGANVEIAEEVKEENMFIFGARIHEVDDIRRKMHEGKRYIDRDIQRVFDSIKKGMFGDLSCSLGIIDGYMQGHDHYIVCADFNSYVEA